MSNLRNLRDVGLVLAGVLAGASLFSVTEQASSAFREGDTIMGAIIIEKDKRDRWEHQPNNSEGWEESHEALVTIGLCALRHNCFQITKTVALSNWMFGSTAAC
jgi:hypothetical protein